MIQKIKNIALSLSLLLGFAAPLAVPAAVFAQGASIDQNLCSGAELDVSGATCNKEDGVEKAQSLVTTVINIFSLIVGIISVIMIIFGGLRYITSGGDSAKVGAAKNTILYAIIGLVIVALAQTIVRFVLTKTPTV